VRVETVQVGRAVLDVAVARERLPGTLEHYGFYPRGLRERQLRPASVDAP
jgi:hypothetical protein